MKKLFIVIALVLIIALPLAAANPVRANGFGAGVYLGYPAGLTFRYGMDSFRVFGNLTNHFLAGAYLDLGVLYDIFSFEIADIPFYFNAGAQIGLGYYVGTPFRMAADGVVGLSYYFDEQPIELFLNVALGYEFLGSKGFDYKAGIGGIWYFN